MLLQVLTEVEYKASGGDSIMKKISEDCERNPIPIVTLRYFFLAFSGHLSS